MRDMYGNEKRDPVVNAVPTYGTTVPDDAAMDAGKVIALAGGAAGLLAGAMVLLSERGKKDEPKSTLEQARSLIDEAAARARQETGRAESSLLSGLHGLSGDAKKKGKRSRKVAAKRGAKLSRKAQAEKNETLDRIAQFLKDAREDATAMASRQSEEVSGFARQLRSDAEGRAGEARKASRKYSKQARKDAAKARGELGSLADMLKSRVLDAEHQAEGYLGAMVLPKVKELLEETQGAVETGKSRTGELRMKAEKDLIPEARKRAEELRKKAEKDVIPEARKRAEELRKKAETEVIPEARKRAESLSHSVEESARAARETIGAEASGAAAKLSATAATVEEHASEAGEAVKRGSRETRSLLLWVALAGVLVFTVFLDEDQQKRLKEIAYEIFGEAKDMYADMKGEETFQS